MLKGSMPPRGQIQEGINCNCAKVHLAFLYIFRKELHPTGVMNFFFWLYIIKQFLYIVVHINTCVKKIIFGRRFRKHTLSERACFSLWTKSVKNKCFSGYAILINSKDNRFQHPFHHATTKVLCLSHTDTQAQQHTHPHTHLCCACISPPSIQIIFALENGNEGHLR